MHMSRRSLLAAAGAVALAAGLPGATAMAAPRLRPGTAQPGRSRYVRKDVSGLFDPETGAWAPELYWYAKAVGWMKEQQQSDPRSWRFQWYTHGRTERSQDDPPEWHQCPHRSPYFLPWHRWYLYHFERIVRSVIVAELGRDDMSDWALPYWNYAHLAAGGAPEDSQEWRRVPLPFRQRRIRSPQGAEEEENPLYLPVDQQGRCLGDDALDFDQVDPTAAMREDFFWPPEGEEGGRVGFSRSLERFPHGLVHSGIGGLMGSVPTAAGDPVFWLHHANVDRFWNAWMTRHPMPSDWLWPETRPKHDPDDPDLPYMLRDENGERHTLRGPVFAFPQNAYVYESLTDGLGTDEVPSAFLVTGIPQEDVSETFVLVNETTYLGPDPLVLPHEGGGAADAFATAVGPDDRVVLAFEGVRADATPCAAFRVFLGDDESDTDPEGPAFVGHLPFFENVGPHAAHSEGTEVFFDVTETLRQLPDRAWDREGVPVVRVVPDPAAEAGGAVEGDPRLAWAALTVL